MSEPIRTVTVGEATVSVIHFGDVTLPLAPAMGRDPSELVGDAELEDLARVEVIPLQCVLIRTPETTVVVDPGLYDVEDGSPYALAGYLPPTPVMESLALLGVGREDVEHVVVTHAHWDHFNGTALETGEPTFPRARHHVGAADLAAMLAKARDPDTREARSIAHAARAGLTEAVTGDKEIAPGITLMAAPGETPGHQVVRVASGSPPSVLFALGDLVHHPVEFSRPVLMVGWADPTTAAASRRRVYAAALEDRALLVAAHIPEVGTLEGRGGVGWRTVADAR